jgi:small subunit ribosomal protein S20
MPVTRGAQKKLRQDKKREKTNLVVKKAISYAIKQFKKSPGDKKISQVYSLLDKASKKQIFHKNKTSRLKSRLSKLIKKIPHKSTQKNK